jgi:IS4 transposase
MRGFGGLGDDDELWSDVYSVVRTDTTGPSVRYIHSKRDPASPVPSIWVCRTAILDHSMYENADLSSCRWNSEYENVVLRSQP